MRNKQKIFSVIAGGVIQFMGFKPQNAIGFAQLVNGNVYSFPSKLVAKWRDMSSINRAAEGTVSITTEEMIALSRIGMRGATFGVPLQEQIEREIKAWKFELCSYLEPIGLNVEGESNGSAESTLFIDATGTPDPNQVSIGHVLLSVNIDRQIEEIFSSQIDNITQILDPAVTESTAEEIAKEVLKKAEKRAKDFLIMFPRVTKNCHSRQVIIDEINLALNQTLNNLTAKINKEIEAYTTNQSVIKDPVDPVTTNKVLRWKTRCNILDDIKEKDINGLYIPYKEIAEKNHVSTSLVTAIKKQYEDNENLTHNDLWEKKRGRKPNPFTIITVNEYTELTHYMSTIGPFELGLPFFSWSGAAIYYYFRKKGKDIKLSYIYNFCNKMGITSKFASRKNPKESAEEIAYFKDTRYPEICKRSILENRRMLFVDECHISIGYNMMGYSLANTPSICSYDASLGHSTYTIVTFMGLDGFIKVFTIKGNVDSTAFTNCLTELKKELKGEKVDIIMDNAPIHTSYETHGWFFGNKNKFDLFFLPRYCPRMNVVEFYNNIFKQELKKDAVMTNESMIKKSLEIVKKYNSGSDEIRKLIQSLFLKEECSYLKDIYEEVRNQLEQNKVA